MVVSIARDGSYSLKLGDGADTPMSREELGNRARLALGEGVAAEVLIQEFAIR